MSGSDQVERPAWPARRVFLWAGLLALALGWKGWGLVEALSPPDGVFLDFSQEWLSAQNLVHGQPVYQDQTVSVQVHTGRRPEWILQWNAHPPTSVLLAVPLTWLDYPTAHLVWNLLSLAALAASLLVVGRQLGFRLPQALLPMTALLLVCWPLHLQVQHGALNPLLLLLVVGAWSLDRTGQPGGAGAVLGVAAAVKLFPALLFLYFLLRRRWRALAAGAACLVVLTAVTLAVEGWESYRTYAIQVLPDLARFRNDWENASLTGFWSRLFDPPPGVWARPLWKAPALVWPAVAASAGLLLALWCPVAYRARCLAEGDRAFALGVTVMLLVSPITWNDYFLLLLLPVAWLWLRLPEGWPRWALVAELVVLWLPPRMIYLVCLDLDSGRLAGVLAAHVTTPGRALTLLALQFYALLGLFALGLFEARRREGATPPEPTPPAREVVRKNSRPVAWVGAGLTALVGAVFLFPTSRYVVLGLLRKEAFQDGRPTGYWVWGLRHSESQVRQSAAFNLGRIGPEAEEAVPSLAEALHDQDEGVRVNAALALLKMRKSARGAAAALAEALHDESPTVRMDAALALYQVGAGAEPAVPALRAAMRDERNRVGPFHTSIRERAAAALGRIGPGARAAVPDLAAALTDADVAVRRTASEALGRIGPGAQPAVPALTAALRDKDDETRQNAAAALELIVPKARSH